MNILMYYGGFFLAILLFALAILLFIIFRVPSIHRYFRRNGRKGLVKAEGGMVQNNGKKQVGPVHMTLEEFNNRTEIIVQSHADTDHIGSARTEYLGDWPQTANAMPAAKTDDATEVLSETRIL